MRDAFAVVRGKVERTSSSVAKSSAQLRLWPASTSSFVVFNHRASKLCFCLDIEMYKDRLCDQSKLSEKERKSPESHLLYARVMTISSNARLLHVQGDKVQCVRLTTGTRDIRNTEVDLRRDARRNRAPHRRVEERQADLVRRYNARSDAFSG